MDYFFIPRRVARLQYMTARLPLTVLDKYVVAPYWDERGLPRLGFDLFLGSMDGFAGWLLADDHISRQDHAVMRRPESPATARQAHRPSHGATKITAAYQQGHEDDQQARRKADAQAEAEKAPADAADSRRLVRYRPEEPDGRSNQQGHEDDQQARRKADAQAEAEKAPADAADSRRLVRYRPEEPDGRSKPKATATRPRATSSKPTRKSKTPSPSS